MNQQSFVAAAHAKCIIAGEHIVLRGKPAIVFPVFNKKITLSYNNEEYFNTSKFKDSDFAIYFMDVLSKAIALANPKQKIAVSSNQFMIENNIPIGAGIGFSAALCVVIARWLMWKDYLKYEDFFSFCRHLENIFHGKSSGLDIAGVMSDFGVHYEISGDVYKINSYWQPGFYLSYSGEPKNTKKAIQHVEEIRKKNPKLAKFLDREMQHSVIMVEDALGMDKDHGFPLLVEAIQHANHCFINWNLIPSTVQNHIEWIKELGAVAVKPTGSGEGGYVLSLWKEPPPLNTGEEFIPLFFHETV